MKQLIVFSFKKSRQVYFVSYFMCCWQGMAWNGIKWNGRRFFHIPYWQFWSIPFPFYSILKVFHSIFHSILKFSFKFRSILPYQRKCRLKAMQRLFCCFAFLQCCKQPLVKVRQQHEDATIGIWYAYCT